MRRDDVKALLQCDTKQASKQAKGKIVRRLPACTTSADVVEKELLLAQ
jgi:hypothetical protein